MKYTNIDIRTNNVPAITENTFYGINVTSHKNSLRVKVQRIKFYKDNWGIIAKDADSGRTFLYEPTEFYDNPMECIAAGHTCLMNATETFIDDYLTPTRRTDDDEGQSENSNQQ